MSYLTSTKNAALLAEVQKNPEILTANATYVADLIDRAADFIASYCCLARYPELTQGYSKSAANAGTDLRTLETNALLISVNGSGAYEVVIDLANCDTGAHTAAELQTCIRDSDVDGFDEVTATYTGTQYTITSGRYGPDSAILLGFSSNYTDVALAMKLSPHYGGTEYPGGWGDDELDSACIMLTEHLYNKAGIEGMTGGGVPGGVSFSDSDLDPRVQMILNARRRLF